MGDSGCGTKGVDEDKNLFISLSEIVRLVVFLSANECVLAGMNVFGRSFLFEHFPTAYTTI